MIGTIKKKTDRGFGFIARDGEERDLFFHSNGVDKSTGLTFDQLQEGDKVEFDLEDTDKGPSAKNVKRAE